MSRRLIIVAVVGIFLILAVIIHLEIVTSSKIKKIESEYAKLENNRNELETEEKEDAICFTASCVHTASNILKNMNLEVDPCEDFFEFTCGGFIDLNPIADGEIGIDTFAVIEKELEEQIRTSIEEPSHFAEPRPFKLVKDLYKTCMNKSAIEKTGLEPLHKLLSQLGDWPVIKGDNWKEEDFNWMESVHRFQKFGCSIDNFISLGSSIEWKNSTKNVLRIDQAAFYLSRKYLAEGADNKIVEAYFKYMVDIAVILGADRQRATQELRESLEFEINLANIASPDSERRNFTRLYNPMSIAELQKQYPSIRWEDYINKLLPPTVQVNASEVILVWEPNFIRGLEELLNKTSKRIQANYVMWRATAASIKYLSEDIRKIQLEFSRALNGKTESAARWRECVYLVLEALPMSTGALYIRKYFNQDAKQNAVEIVANIREEFINILKTSEWMDDTTRNKALEKAATMSSHIAYPDELLEDNKLEEYYASLELRPNDYIGNIQNLSLFHTKQALEKLREPVNKSEWISHGHPVMVNAFYTLTENSIQLPAGILQDTFFTNDRPQYMNYGAMGYVIGHEITHGFDDRGRQFDKRGNLVDWWTPETDEKYLEKVKCIIHQYSNYTVEAVGLKLNGIHTQGENVADNGGIEVAYQAYKEWMKRNGPEPELPGLKYTPEQMFWISAANVWCAKFRPEALKHAITTDIHSPGQFRVLGPFSNMPEFAADFNCSKGSVMNPEKKCSVW